MIKYTIILPVYNAEKYLIPVLDKFKKLDRDDIELLIINDGSKDNSLSIIESYNIKNLVCINQENHGVSFSRNKGIRNARGKYINFLDCDDSFDETLFEKIDKLYDKDFDLIRYGFYLVSNKNKKESKIVEKVVTTNKFQDDLELYSKMYTTGIMNVPWNQMIKKSILLKNKVFFNEKHKYAEDFEFNRCLLHYIDSIYLMPDCLYMYNVGNISSTSNNEKYDNVKRCINDAIEIHSKSYDMCRKECPLYLAECFYNVTLEFMTVVRRLFFIRNMSLKEVKDELEKIQKRKEILNLKIEYESNKYKTFFLVNNLLFKKITIFNVIIYKTFFVIKRKAKKLLVGY